MLIYCIRKVLQKYKPGISISVIPSLLHKEGITEIEIPGLYVLDYEYHMKRNEKLLEDLKKDWPQERILEQPERYKKEKLYTKYLKEKQHQFHPISSR